jgi:hypothetical protein
LGEKSRCWTPKLCGASRRTLVSCRSRLPSANWTPKILRRMPQLNVIPSRLPFAKSTAEGPPFSMRGVPAQDYSGLGLKSQTPARKSAQLSRAPARAAALAKPSPFSRAVLAAFLLGRSAPWVPRNPRRIDGPAQIRDSGTRRVTASDDARLHRPIIPETERERTGKAPRARGDSIIIKQTPAGREPTR